jgi:hypothetical protein
MNSRAAASTIARRVARACAARNCELYGFLTGWLISGDYQCNEVIDSDINLR